MERSSVHSSGQHNATLFLGIMRTGLTIMKRFYIVYGLACLRFYFQEKVNQTETEDMEDEKRDERSEEKRSWENG